jgi:hypothetical protein
MVATTVQNLDRAIYRVDRGNRVGGIVLPSGIKGPGIHHERTMIHIDRSNGLVVLRDQEVTVRHIAILVMAAEHHRTSIGDIERTIAEPPMS